ncbi:unnamed protein product [Rhizopus stolonifer]
MSTNPPNSVENAPPDIDKMLVSYLQKKGFHSTEAIFLRELRGESVSLQNTNDIKQESTQQQQYPEIAPTQATTTTVEEDEDEEEEDEEDPDMYSVSYNSLREWIKTRLIGTSLNYVQFCFPSLFTLTLILSVKACPKKPKNL